MPPVKQTNRNRRPNTIFINLHLKKHKMNRNYLKSLNDIYLKKIESGAVMSVRKIN